MLSEYPAPVLSELDLFRDELWLSPLFTEKLSLTPTDWLLLKLAEADSLTEAEFLTEADSLAEKPWLARSVEKLWLMPVV